MSAAIAFTFAVALLASVTFHAWRKRASLNLTDAFLISIALFFGAYTLVDQMVNTVRWLDPVVVFATFIQIALGAVALRVFRDAAPAWVRGRTSFQALYEDLGVSRGALVIGILVAGLAFRVVSADMVADLEVQNPDLVAQLEADLPYWFKSLAQLLPLIVFTAGLAAAAKAFAGRGATRLWWAAWTFASVVFFFGAGRRALLALLLIVFWMYVRSRRNAVILILCAAIGIPVLIGASNLFQAYREVAYRGAVVSKTDAGILLEQAANLDLTATNLQNREAIWRFNANVMQADRSGQRAPGELLLNTLGNYVPAVLSRNKTVFDAEKEMMRDRGMREYDGASNVFVLTYADFGLLSFLIAPALLILFIGLVALTLRRLSSPHLRALLLASALYYALNIEVNYGQPAQMVRDFLIVAFLHWIVTTGLRMLRPGERRGIRAPGREVRRRVLER